MASRHARGHCCILGCGYRRLVKENVRTLQAAFRVEIIAIRRFDLRTELRQREEMRIDAPTTNDITTWWRQNHATDSCEHRTSEQNGCADFCGLFRIELGQAHIFRTHTHGVRR